MKRREFMRTAGGSAAAVTATAATSGTVLAQEEGEDEGGDDGGGGGDVQPTFDGYIDDADGGVEDLRGQEAVTVEVGASGNGGDLAFSPAGIWIDPGTTVTWEWTGNGGEHNVVAVDGPAELESDLTDEAGFTYEFTFEEGQAGLTTYHCEPHDDLEMKGGVAVGDDVETEEVAAGSGGWPEDFAHDVGVPLQKHYIGIVTFLGIAISLVFTFYILKYGESPNTGRGGT
ncbi:halocyanin domain-containing protein [Haloferacaceae archaeon DSL9]